MIGLPDIDSELIARAKRRAFLRHRRHAHRGYFDGDFLLRPARHVHLIREFKWKQKTFGSCYRLR